MLDLKSYMLNIFVKVGWRKKPESVGFDLRNSSRITMRNVKISGFDKAMKTDNVRDLDASDVSAD